MQYLVLRQVTNTFNLYSIYTTNRSYLSQSAENFDLPLSSIVASAPAKSMDSSTTIAIMVHSPRFINTSLYLLTTPHTNIVNTAHA